MTAAAVTHHETSWDEQNVVVSGSSTPVRSATRAAIAADEASDKGTEGSWEQFFLSHLETVDRVVAFISRRNRLTADEAEEFRSIVYLGLIDDNYSVLRKFERRSSLRTYLSVVIQRLFLDYRTSHWGKWRPSMHARRRGKTAVLLEQLTMCQGLSFDQARNVLDTVHHVDVSHPALEEMYRYLPRRTRRQFVGEDALASVPCPDAAADCGLATEGRRLSAARTSEVLREELSALSAEDLLILRLRFVEGLTVGDIARELSTSDRVDPRALYRRLRRLLAWLRTRMEHSGLERAQVLEALGLPDVIMPRVLARRPATVLPHRRRDEGLFNLAADVSLRVTPDRSHAVYPSAAAECMRLTTTSV